MKCKPLEYHEGGLISTVISHKDCHYRKRTNTCKHDFSILETYKLRLYNDILK